MCIRDRDYHLHTDFSGDSTTPPRAQIERAIQLGMDSLCITDHHDYDVDSIIDFTLDLDPYMSSLARLQEEYRDRIDVRIGIELGLQVHLKDYFKELTDVYKRQVFRIYISTADRILDHFP